MSAVPVEGVSEPEQGGTLSQVVPFMTLRPTPLAIGAKRYEVYGKSILVRRMPCAHVGHGRSLTEKLLLLDWTAQTFKWQKARGATAIFVRAFEVLGEFPEGIECYWMEISDDLHGSLLHDFRSAIADVGARYRSGEAADLIFLAQLTPVS